MDAIRPKLRLLTLTVMGVVLLTASARGQLPDPPGQVAPGDAPKVEAYLFAHMMHGDY